MQNNTIYILLFRITDNINLVFATSSNFIILWPHIWKFGFQSCWMGPSSVWALMLVTLTCNLNSKSMTHPAPTDHRPLLGMTQLIKLNRETVCDSKNSLLTDLNTLFHLTRCFFSHAIDKGLNTLHTLFQCSPLSSKDFGRPLFRKTEPNCLERDFRNLRNTCIVLNIIENLSIRFEAAFKGLVRFFFWQMG